ncbi:hypothetical protein ASF27_01610 [Methylobacterium sp. Leaf102]|uniref:helix-turn-helix domain-containing protein n=1 Tax=Methylobacterium sp. Leaf102 TaxID=1736253 RepID=UPI0006FE208A|nr:hypothetical protein ASF27_01610 [Methylobacterium sp. Leaf102]
MRRPFLTSEQHEQIAARREAGESIGQLAQAYGCSRSNISAVCLKFGIEPPGARPITPVAPGPNRIERGGILVRRFSADEDSRLLTLEAAGHGYIAIGAALDRHPNSVRYRLMTLARHQARSEAA